MIFSIAIIVAILGVTYMHYLQGAFTSAISLACALAAALVAFGYYENLVNMMAQGGFADYAGGVSLIVLFALTYGVLRVLVDMIVPGNIQLQLYIEKAGAAVFGFMAAVLGAGTFATAVQMMPVGPAVAGYARYEVQDRDVIVPATLSGRQRGSDTSVANEVVKPTFDGQTSAMLLPADNLVLSIVATASNGAMSGSQSFTAIHPDLPTEAFGSRVGAEGSGKHAILNTSKGTNVNLVGLYTLRGEPKGLDTEVSDLRPQKTNLTYKSSANEVLVVARVTFEAAAADKDGIVRLTPAAARLVVNGQTFYPLGTMDGPGLIGLNRIDDELFIPVTGNTRGVDLVYALPKAVATTLAKPAGESDVRFIELKLFGRIDLSAKTTEQFKPSNETKVLRKSTSPLGKGKAA